MKYIHTRFRWSENLDMDALEELLSEDFSVKRREYPKDDVEVSLFKNERTEVIARADRIQAHMTSRRATISQFEEGPFTMHDMELREIVIEKYPRNRPSPFPWSLSIEPKFEIENQSQ